MARVFSKCLFAHHTPCFREFIWVWYGITYPTYRGYLLHHGVPHPPKSGVLRVSKTISCPSKNTQNRILLCEKQPILYISYSLDATK